MRVVATLLILLGCGVQPGIIAAQQQEPSVSVAEADTYVRAVFAESREGEYGKATQTYLWLLEQWDGRLRKDDAALVNRHVAQMIFLLSDASLPLAVEGTVRTVEGFVRDKWTLRRGAGQFLSA